MSMFFLEQTDKRAISTPRRKTVVSLPGINPKRNVTMKTGECCMCRLESLNKVTLVVLFKRSRCRISHYSKVLAKKKKKKTVAADHLPQRPASPCKDFFIPKNNDHLRAHCPTYLIYDHWLKKYKDSTKTQTRKTIVWLQ